MTFKKRTPPFLPLYGKEAKNRVPFAAELFFFFFFSSGRELGSPFLRGTNMAPLNEGTLQFEHVEKVFVCFSLLPLHEDMLSSWGGEFFPPLSRQIDREEYVFHLSPLFNCLASCFFSPRLFTAQKKSSFCVPRYN